LALYFLCDWARDVVSNERAHSTAQLAVDFQQPESLGRHRALDEKWEAVLVAMLLDAF
jgi:hypothetical protein